MLKGVKFYTLMINIGISLIVYKFYNCSLNYFFKYLFFLLKETLFVFIHKFF
jgi:hypothetical protein